MSPRLIIAAVMVAGCLATAGPQDSLAADRKVFMTQDGIQPHEQLGLIALQASPRGRISPVPIHAVEMGDGFWRPWMEANRAKGIPALYHQLEEHGAIDNFRLISGRKQGERRGPYFTDSDVYKWMEGAATALETSDDPYLEKLLDGVIDEVAAAQRQDGYINTFFTGELENQRFRNLGDEHELYCAGHLFQAAVAHYRATGKRKLLDVALRFADFMVDHFGEGKIEQPDGHPEVEMALVELYRVTGKRDYLDLAGFFLKRQDYGRNGQISGHAVRAAYLVGGAADYYLETGEREAKVAAESLWTDMASGRVYITGGLGARHAGEAIGERYELPNETAYAETCAAIANTMWNFRMLGYSAEGRFSDMMERALYNNVLSGISLDTTHWFYVNPLACFGKHVRLPWYGCTCCPTNVVRTLAAIPGYMYGVSDEGVWVHLYDESSVKWKLPDGRGFSILQKTRFPWEGDVQITVEPDGTAEQEFAVFLRIPEWASGTRATVNGKAVQAPKAGGYLEIKRAWKAGDEILLEFPMDPVRMESDPLVRSNYGSVAIQRGPVVYCAESIDNPGVSLRDAHLRPSARLDALWYANKLGGIVEVRADASSLPADAERGPLYRPAETRNGDRQSISLVLIPYYAWSNRGESQMTVWLPVDR